MFIQGGFDAIFCIGIGEASIERLSDDVWNKTDKLMPLLCGNPSESLKEAGLRIEIKG